MISQRPLITRFAPSPNGYLHLGHAYAAMVAHGAARGSWGRFFLRIEDLDLSRSRPEYEQAIFDDLGWLGLTWERIILRQSQRFAIYSEALGALKSKGLLYPCFCTRQDIAREIERAGVAPQGPEGPLYPGTCRHLGEAERERRLAAGDAYALRLNMERAMHMAGALTWVDEIAGEQQARPERLGDVVLARKDVPASYHLAVVVDDATQGITLVTRGRDLFEATHVHRLLQKLLWLPTPRYRHHALVVDRAGHRLAKSAASTPIRELRAAGHSPDDVREMALAGLETVEG
jgi:glutamyl-Q tRNA(Asp) synthetase